MLIIDSHFMFKKYEYAGRLRKHMDHLASYFDCNIHIRKMSMKQNRVVHYYRLRHYHVITIYSLRILLNIR